MLAQSVKDSIQGAYRQMISAKELTPRYGQRLMIAEIAKAFGSLPNHAGPPPIVVVEAGVGTGVPLRRTVDPDTVPVDLPVIRRRDWSWLSCLA